MEINPRLAILILLSSTSCFAKSGGFTCRDLLTDTEFQRILNKDPKAYTLDSNLTGTSKEGQQLTCDYILKSEPIRTEALTVNVTWWSGNPGKFTENASAVRTGIKTDPAIKDLSGFGSWALEDTQLDPTINVFTNNKKYLFFVKLTHYASVDDPVQKTRALARAINDHLNHY